MFKYAHEFSLMDTKIRDTAKAQFSVLGFI